MPKAPPPKARKPKNTKGQAFPTRKTDRRNHKPETRAYLVGALSHSNTSYYKLQQETGIPRNTIWQIYDRVKRRAEEQGLALHDHSLYQDDSEPWVNKSKLTEEHKEALVFQATKDREARYCPPDAAIALGICQRAGAPDVHVETFKTVINEYRYGRIKAGWKFMLTAEQKKIRLEWALTHNPDPSDERPEPFNWLLVVFTDETPAKVGVKRGRFTCWATHEEKYHPDVKQDKQSKYSELQFWASFAYNNKGPCHMYAKETQEQKDAAEKDLHERNQRRAQQHMTRDTARRALRQLGESEINSGGVTLRLQNRALAKLDSEKPLNRRDRTRGGIDGYRHEQEVLRPLLGPFVERLNREPYLQEGQHYWVLEDGAPAHTSRFDKEFYIKTGLCKLLWPSHSPDINAAEHAWPWLRKEISFNFTPSTTEQEATDQWIKAWEEHTPISKINRWITRIPNKVRKIIQQEGDNCFHG